jgi:site-specific DNA-methyltransferase (adenine-specific)
MLFQSDFYTGQKTIESHTVDLITVDPPYGVLKTVDWDKPIDWGMTEKVFAELINPFGQVIIFCNFKLMLEIINTFGKLLEFRHFHIWNKSSAFPTSQYSPIPNSEFILLFRRKGVKPSELVFNPKETLQTAKPYSKKNKMRDVSIRQEKKPEVDNNPTGARHIKHVIQAPSKPNMLKVERSSHPTQKPLLLMRELIRVYSNPGQLIVSPFAGSGTDLIAAEIEGRRSIGFEMKQEYYDEAVARIAKYRSQGGLFGKDAS